MKVSIIVRTYNRGYIIGEALASALAQTYRDFEIIVVDDGSTDDTFELVSGFRSSKIRYIKHDTNRGVSVAGNTGIKAATGDLIAHLDSDDLWRPDMLSSLVGFLSRHSEVDAVFCDVEVIRDAKSAPSIVSSMNAFPKLLAMHGSSRSDEFVFSKREMYLCLLEEVPIKPTAVLIRRSILDTVGAYNASWVSGEDWELYLRISKAHRFGYLNRRLATMRVRADSTLSKFFEQDKVFLSGLAIREKATLGGDREALRAVNRAISRHHKDLGWVYRSSGRPIKCMFTYARGFAETGDFFLLIRSVLALIPVSVTHRLRYGEHVR